MHVGPEDTWKTEALSYISEALSDVLRVERWCAFAQCASRWPAVPGPVRDVVNRMVELCRDLDAEATARELELEFARLFLTPGGVYPYESMYLGQEGHLMDEPFVQVRRFYREHGVCVQPGHPYPDDHLAVEVSFLAHQWAAGETSTFYRFLSEHVLRWVQSCLEDLRSKTRSPWYVAIVDLLQAMVEWESDKLAR
jgi:TorA maturation chaperone TorD